MSKWQERKRNVGNQITNLSESTKDIIIRLNILVYFVNRVPEVYIKAKLDEKCMILTTITESITINAETDTITVRLRPVIKHLRLAKNDLVMPLKNRSERAKRAL